MTIENFIGGSQIKDSGRPHVEMSRNDQEVLEGLQSARTHPPIAGVASGGAAEPDPAAVWRP